jgi:hypothetical protein
MGINLEFSLGMEHATGLRLRNPMGNPLGEGTWTEGRSWSSP